MWNLQDGIDHDHADSGLTALLGGLGKGNTGLDEVGRVTDLNVGPDEPQAQRASNRRYDSRAATTQHVDEEDVVDDRGDGLDKSVDTRIQRDVLNTEGLEQGRRVVVDGGGTGHVLQGESEEHEQDTIAHAPLAELLEGSAVEGEGTAAEFGRDRCLILEPGLNGGDVLLDVLVLDGEVAQVHERLLRLFNLALAHQPQRALVQEKAADEERDGGDELHGHGNPKARCGVDRDVLVNAVVDPEAD